MKLFVFLAISLPILISSCVDEKFDKPEPVIPHFDGKSNKSIADLKAMYAGTLDSIEQDIIIQGVVVANDESGNFYKTLIIQDGTGGIELKLDKYDLYTTFKVGQRVFVKCKGLYLGDYGGLVQIGYIYNGAIGRIPDVMVGTHLFRDSLPGSAPVAKNLTIPTLTPDNLSMIVQIDNVHFVEAGSSFANSTAVTNRAIEDESGNKLALRTSNYASFAANKIPNGKGSIRGILSIFNGGYQFYIRDINDIFNWIDPSANMVVYEMFNIDPFGAGWSAVSLASDKNWYYNSGYKCVAINGNGANDPSDDYLISPPINLSGISNPVFSFSSWTRYIDNGLSNPLEVLVSENYSDNPSTATWTKLDATLSAQNSDTWTPSNNINLNAYSGKTIRIAFHYRSSGNGASSYSAWQIDDVKIAK